MRRPIAVAILASAFAIAVGVLVFVVLWHQKERYENAYLKLAVGTPKSEVVKTFGLPTRTSKCGLMSSWDGDRSTNKSACVEEYWYESRITPEQWIVGFDAKGQAVTKYYFVSP